jgi:hypothetical protein
MDNLRSQWVQQLRRKHARLHSIDSGRIRYGTALQGSSEWIEATAEMRAETEADIKVLQHAIKKWDDSP